MAAREHVQLVHGPNCGCIVHRHERAVAEAKAQSTTLTHAPTVKPEPKLERAAAKPRKVVAVSNAKPDVKPVSNGAARIARWRSKQDPEVRKQQNREAIHGRFRRGPDRQSVGSWAFRTCPAWIRGVVDRGAVSRYGPGPHSLGSRAGAGQSLTGGSLCAPKEARYVAVGAGREGLQRREEGRAGEPERGGLRTGDLPQAPGTARRDWRAGAAQGEAAGCRRPAPTTSTRGASS
jgi:hypothetical protein